MVKQKLLSRHPAAPRQGPLFKGHKGREGSRTIGQVKGVKGELEDIEEEKVRERKRRTSRGGNWRSRKRRRLSCFHCVVEECVISCVSFHIEGRREFRKLYG